MMVYKKTYKPSSYRPQLSINFKIYCFCLFSRLRFFCIREGFSRLLFWNILKSATNRRSRIPARYKKSHNSSQANSEIFRFSYSLHSRWPFFFVYNSNCFLKSERDIFAFFARSSIVIFCAKLFCIYSMEERILRISILLLLTGEFFLNMSPWWFNNSEHSREMR